jgi:hypothetical protein
MASLHDRRGDGISGRRENAISGTKSRRTRLRKYTLFTTGPEGRISCWGRDYYSGMWIARIRAKSIKDAYYLLAHQIGAPGGRNSRGESGILTLSSSQPLSLMGWPWDLPLSQYGPTYWHPSELPPKGWPKHSDDIMDLERAATRHARQRLGLNGPFVSGADIVRLADAVENEMHRVVKRSYAEQRSSARRSGK